MKEPDSIFWDRLADMPFAEAEQECVIRRENNSLEIAMLQQEISAILDRTGVRNQEAKSIGSEMAGIMAQNTILNERIKYLRRLQDKVKWKEAVRAVFGDDAVDQCVVWIEQTCSPMTEEI